MNLKGKKWSDLTQTQQNKLMLQAKAIDGITGNEPKETTECIIDFDNVSIIGKFIIEENENNIKIENESIFYDPTE